MKAELLEVVPESPEWWLTERPSTDPICPSKPDLKHIAPKNLSLIQLLLTNLPADRHNLSPHKITVLLPVSQTANQTTSFRSHVTDPEWWEAAHFLGPTLQRPDGHKCTWPTPFPKHS